MNDERLKRIEKDDRAQWRFSLLSTKRSHHHKTLLRHLATGWSAEAVFFKDVQ